MLVFFSCTMLLSYGQKKPTLVAMWNGQRSVWVTEFVALGRNDYVLRGVLSGKLILGSDTLHKPDCFDAYYNNRGLRFSVPDSGHIGNHPGDKHAFFKVGYSGPNFNIWKVSRIDANGKRLWQQVVTSKRDSPFLQIFPPVQDDRGNTYVLYKFGGRYAHLDTITIKEPGSLLVKLDEVGGLIGHKFFPGKDYNRLRIFGDRLVVQAYQDSAIFLNTDLVKLDADLIKLNTDLFKVIPVGLVFQSTDAFRTWDKNTGFRLLGKSMERCDVKSGRCVEKIYRSDTTRRGPVDYGRLLKWNRRKLVVVSVTLTDKRGGIEMGKDINIVVVRKKDLKALREIKLHADASVLPKDDYIMGISDNSLIITATFLKSGKLGDIDLQIIPTDEREKWANREHRQVYIVKQPLD
jgi:hypothetical protein